ncbi:MAG: ferrous iron transport protein [Fibrobacterota bacterium]|jgi:ferrous iron transport protein B
MTVLALAGQANGGKTSLFNWLTGSRAKTVNYPGATVDCALGALRGASFQAHVLDTPGILSLVPRSQDEAVAVQALRNPSALIPESSVPDLVIAVVDMSQPHRPLVLVHQMARAGFRMVVALTMPDLAERRGCALDPVRLSDALNLPVHVVNGRTGEGVPALLESCGRILSNSSAPQAPVLPEGSSQDEIQSDYLWAEKVVEHALHREQVQRKLSFDPDRILLNPWVGFLTFALVMTGFFWAIFAAAAPLQDGVELLFTALADLAARVAPAGFLADLLKEGIFPGFQAVLVFVPQIAILFFMLGVLEDTGYLARGTVVIDRPLSMLGLNGRSFVPLLSGFACAIPAMMAARTIPGRKERLLTLLVIPLMSCSARLPVYGLLLALLFAGNPAMASLGMTAIYLGSVLIGSLACALLSRSLSLPATDAGFQIELPAWRMPMWRTVVISALERTWGYVQRAGGTIFAISIVFWLLNRYPTPEHSFALQAGRLLEPLVAPLGGDWRIAVALLAAFAAREVFVSALAVVFAVQASADATAPLLESLRNATHATTGLPLFTTATIAGLVVYFMISMQCLSTFAVFRKEWGSWRIASLQLLGYVVLGWLLAVGLIQGLHALGVP